MKISRVNYGPEIYCANVYMSQMERDMIVSHFNLTDPDTVFFDLIPEGPHGSYKLVITKEVDKRTGKPLGGRIVSTHKGGEPRFMIKQGNWTGMRDKTPPFNAVSAKYKCDRAGIMPVVHIVAQGELKYTPSTAIDKPKPKTQRTPGLPPATKPEDAIPVEPPTEAQQKDFEKSLDTIAKEGITPIAARILGDQRVGVTAEKPPIVPGLTLAPTTDLDRVKDMVYRLNEMRGALKLVYKINKETGNIEVHRVVTEKLF